MKSENEKQGELPEFKRVTSDTIVMTQNESLRELGRIVATNWDYDAQDVFGRPIVVTAIRSQFRKIIGVTIHVGGTPVRGMLTVMLTGRPTIVRVDDPRRELNKRATTLVFEIARKVVSEVWLQAEATQEEVES